MFRPTLLRAGRLLATKVAPVAPLRAAVRVSAPVVSKPFAVPAIRFYSSDPGALSKIEVESRVLDLLKGFDKVGLSIECRQGPRKALVFRAGGISGMSGEIDADVRVSLGCR
jgi:hypothetical protein